MFAKQKSRNSTIFIEFLTLCIGMGILGGLITLFEESSLRFWHVGGLLFICTVLLLLTMLAVLYVRYVHALRYAGQLNRACHVDTVKATKALTDAQLSHFIRIHGLPRYISAAPREAGEVLALPCVRALPDWCYFFLRNFWKNKAVWLDAEDLESVTTLEAQPEAEAVLPVAKQKKYEVTTAEAAKMLDVSPRTISYWDKGQAAPEGYPGRYSQSKFITWTYEYKRLQSNKQYIRQINSPMTGFASDRVPDDEAHKVW